MFISHPKLKLKTSPEMALSVIYALIMNVKVKEFFPCDYVEVFDYMIAQLINAIYTAHTLDGIIDKLVRQIFERMKAVPKSEIVNVRYKEKMDERRALLRSIRAVYTKAAGELEMLRAEVIKSLRGESAFSQDLLGSLIADAETKCLEVQQQLEAAQVAYDEGQAVLASLNAQYDDIISWADMYDTASIEAKKMIVNCLIKRVDVYRDYKLHIDFNIDFEQFSMGLDIVWIAA